MNDTEVNLENVKDFVNLKVFDCNWFCPDNFEKLNSKTENKSLKLLMNSLYSLVIAVPNIEETVNHFVYLLLHYFEYHGDTLSNLLLPQSTPNGSSLTIGNQNREGNADFFLVDYMQKSKIKLIIENKSTKSALNCKDVEGQLAAQAITAYQSNRQSSIDKNMTLLLPAIIMIDSCPTFYLYHLQPEFIRQVERWDQKISKITYVERFKIESSHGSPFFSSLNDRELICKCFVAFKNYMDINSDAYKKKLSNHKK